MFRNANPNSTFRAVLADWGKAHRYEGFSRGSICTLIRTAVTARTLPVSSSATHRPPGWTSWRSPITTQQSAGKRRRGQLTSPGPPVKGIELSTRNLGLRVTGPSDHHGTRRNDHDPGCNLRPRRRPGTRTVTLLRPRPHVRRRLAVGAPRPNPLFRQSSRRQSGRGFRRRILLDCPHGSSISRWRLRRVADGRAGINSRLDGSQRERRSLDCLEPSPQRPQRPAHHGEGPRVLRP